MDRSNSGTVYEIPGRDSVHPFPARMAPGLALDVVAECSKSLRVLDPMSGSGTVPAVARSKEHRAIGVDIDPLAVLISRVWTTPVDTETLRRQAADVLRHSRSLFASLRTRDAYPANSDAETRSFVRYWFDDYARRQLASLATAIREVEGDTIRSALWCAFSRLIITKQSGASLAMDLSHSRPHRAFKRAPSKPFRKFLYAVDRVARNCIDSSDQFPGPPARIHEGDARSLPLDDGCIDLVLTSPPYLNAIDYLRCSKFSLIWMGYSIGELRGVRSVAVGTEVGKNADDDLEIQNVLSRLNLQPKLRTRQEAVLARYIDDIRRVVGETVRVLTDRGQAVFVVGENTVRWHVHSQLADREHARGYRGAPLRRTALEGSASQPSIPAATVGAVETRAARRAYAPRGGSCIQEGGLNGLRLLRDGILLQPTAALFRVVLVGTLLGSGQ